MFVTTRTTISVSNQRASLLKMKAEEEERMNKTIEAEKHMYNLLLISMTMYKVPEFKNGEEIYGDSEITSCLT